MLRNLWFQIHWLLGTTAGLVLAIVGVTGGMLSFQDDILRTLNPGIISVTPRGAELPPAELMARVQTASAGKHIQSFTISSDPAESARVMFAPARASAPVATVPAGTGGQRGEMRYVDPYTGEVLAPARGRDFFQTVEQLHRRLLSGDTGKQIVGAATLCLMVLALSGLYLRWPRDLGNWRTWLTFKFAKQGRHFLWGMHSVMGTWALLFYLLTGFTGLVMSYDWLRNGLYDISGVPRPQPLGSANGSLRAARADDAAAPAITALQVNSAAELRRDPVQEKSRPDGQPHESDSDHGNRKEHLRAGDSAHNIDHNAHDVGARQRPAFDAGAAWAIFQQTVPAFSSATLRVPEQSGQSAQFTYLDPNPPHERAFNRLSINAATGEVKQHERYADKSAAGKLLASDFPIHSGQWFGLPFVIMIMLASLSMPAFAITGWMLYLDRRKPQRAARTEAKTADVPGSPNNPAHAAEEFLIGFASQTGHAERLAWQTARALQTAGTPVTVRPLSQLTADMLGRFRHALFVVSTFGDGQPPDNGRGFLQKLMPHPLPLSKLRFGLVTLGDRQYKTFCGFGRSLDIWLRKQGAQPLFDTVEVDNGDPAALQHWRNHLGTLGTDETAFTTLPYARWRLAARRHVNPGSQGGPVYHVELEPMEPTQAHWVSGDLAEILLRHAGGKNNDSPVIPSRQFSIASLPEDGRVHLLIRQTRLPDGSLGLASGWLTEHVLVGSEIEMRIATHNSFHLIKDDRPLILIGNGTGIAGLRAHLKARARAGYKHNWLIFGERNATYDFYYRSDIDNWKTQSVLERLDLAFSRDQADRVYVQQRIGEAAEMLCDWVDAGAAIYVCGSLESMAPAVDKTLADILGAARLDQLAAEQRYRRDLY